MSADTNPGGGANPTDAQQPIVSRSDGRNSTTWEEITQASEMQTARDSARRINVEAISGTLQATPLSDTNSKLIDPAHPPKEMDDLRS